MAGSQVEIVANQIEAQRLGYQAISLTHFADGVEPEIAAGSVVEIGGALFEFGSDEPISGLGAIAAGSDVYIKLTVAATSVTASGVTAPAPTWDTAKQGWYIGGTERVIGGLYKGAAGDYVDKWLYEFAAIDSLKLYGDQSLLVTATRGFRTDPAMPALKKTVVDIGDWNMSVTAFVDVAHGLADFKAVRRVSVIIRNDDDTQYFPLDTINPADFGTAGAIYSIGVANIRLYRRPADPFWSMDFNAAVGYNRGWITIEYEA